jgi:hypothetical protein
MDTIAYWFVWTQGLDVLAGMRRLKKLTVSALSVSGFLGFLL